MKAYFSAELSTNTLLENRAATKKLIKFLNHHHTPFKQGIGSYKGS
jgi:hypothetical protein